MKCINYLFIANVRLGEAPSDSILNCIDLQ